MKAINLVTSILLVGMVILGLTSFLGSLEEEYGADIDYSGLNKTTQRMEETRQTTQNISNVVQNMTLSGGEFIYIPYKMYSVGWGSLKLVGGSILTIEAIFNDAINILNEMGIPIPDWLLPTLIAVIVITVMMIFIYGFFKHKFED